MTPTLVCPACGAPLLDRELPPGAQKPCAACGATIDRKLALEDHAVTRLFDVRSDAWVAAHRTRILPLRHA